MSAAADSLRPGERVLSVLLADDHPLFRAGLRHVLEEHADMRVVAEARDGDACIAQIELLRPDAVVLDLALPVRSGFDVIEWTRLHMPRVACVVMSMHADKAFVQRARQCGARGFVAKEDAADEVVRALRQSDGPFYLSGSAGRSGAVAPPRMDPFDDEDASARGALRTLTPAERRVLALIAKSLTTREIAGRLHLSQNTVQAHRYNIARKLGLSGANRLIEFAIRHERALDHALRDAQEAGQARR